MDEGREGGRKWGGGEEVERRREVGRVVND